MKEIYCVSVDWADKGTEATDVLACFYNMEDAVSYMNKLWREEREQDYFEIYDQLDCTYTKMEAWVDGEWIDSHYCLQISATTLFSEVDVMEGLI